MQIGQSFSFSENFGQFNSNGTYHFIGHDIAKKRVGIVQVHKPALANLVIMDRLEFESALNSAPPIININENRGLLPEWIKKYEGVDLNKIDDFRYKNHKTKHRNRIDQCLELIKDASKDISIILNNENPIKFINESLRNKAQHLRRNINITRERSNLLIYLAHARNEMALLPAFTNCGAKSISTKTNNEDNDKSNLILLNKKKGRPALRGRRQGYNVDETILKKMEGGYIKHKKNKKTMRKIYHETLTSEFGCKVYKVAKGLFRMSHPTNQPFPSEGQFRYHMKNLFTQKVIRTNVLGESFIRRTESAHIGSYSDGVCLIGEQIQFDGKVIDEYPISFDGQNVLEKITALRMIDVASGMFLGVGGGLGSEDIAVHQSALFCAAVDKVRFCRLFGIEIDTDDWNLSGLSPALFGDRGPGMSATFAHSDNATLRSFGRSYQGQDKANIETSHPKSINIEGKQPLYYATNNPVDIFIKFIHETIKHNRTADMSSRLTPEMVASGVVPTPIGISEFLISKGRIMMEKISFDDAVRKYTTPIKATVYPSGVKFNCLPYRSDELFKSGLTDYTVKHGAINVEGYVLELCVATIWIEGPAGNLIEIKHKPALMDDPMFLPLTHHESILYAEQFKNLVAQQAQTAEAASILYDQECSKIEINSSSRFKPICVDIEKVSKNATQIACDATGASKKAQKQV